VHANTSALLAFVSDFTLSANSTVKKHINPSLTLSVDTAYSTTIDTISNTIATMVLSIAAARLNFSIEKKAIDSSTCESYEP
jgi:hypothetical protein